MGEKLKTFLLLLILFILGVSTSRLISLVEQPNDYTPKSIPNSEQEIIDNCINLELEESCKCLVDNIKTFFLYNKTEDSNNLNFNELKEKGGDCKDWSELYLRLGKGLGFNAGNILIDRTPPGETNHQITIINNGEDYCIIDQKSYWFQNLKNEGVDDE